MKKTINGFTVIELIIVVTVIAILAAIAYVGYNGTQERARDTKRKNDLAMIAEAIQLYREKEGHDVQTVGLVKADCGRYDVDGVTPLGGGSSNAGGGWFNYETPTNTTSYTVSVLHCLTFKGQLNESFVDPSGCATTSGSAAPGYTCSMTGYAYMKYSCIQGGQTVSYIYARLEKLPVATNETDGTCAATLDTSYGMNYYVKAD